ncbi:hypothetical protein ACFQX6_63325 [Streptosporangium lutulentum]
MHPHERVDPLLVDHVQQFHARRRWHVEREVRDLGDEQGLGRLGVKPAASSRSGRSDGRS